jgi:CRISPR-associated exonuclease Cas4
VDHPIPISALQHYVYCPRQCALIHVEQTFDENLYTMRGQRVHERVDAPVHETVEGVRVERALPLFSNELGLTGKADVVEFLADGTPYPVEYKAGTRKHRGADEVQLCAQGMCLEEMLGRRIPEGSLYYDRTRRRRVVKFSQELREKVVTTTHAVRELFAARSLPEPVADSRCPNCSLIDACMPFALKGYAQGTRRNALFEVRDGP